MYFYNMGFNKIPSYIQYVSDYDTWSFEFGKDTEYFKLGTDCLDTSVSSDMWNDLDVDSKNDYDFLSRLVGDGEVIKKYLDAHYKEQIESDGYEAGTLARTTATPTWGDTVVFSASPATEAVVNPQEDLSSFTLVGTYSDEGINLDTLNYGVRQSALKRTAVSVSGYNTLMVEIEFQTDGILAFDPVKTFEFSCQATSHNNAAWNMTYSDIAGYQDTNQVSVRCQILETWCTNGTHGSCWNEETTVGGNTVYVTKLRWMERISDITWYEWIDGKPNSNRCFFAGGVRISLLNDVKVVNYYHRFYLGNLS